MDVVAGEALTVLNGFVDDLFCESGLRIGMTGIAYFVRSVLQHARDVRSMRIMAHGAHLIGERRMLLFQLQGFLCFFMTSKTQRSALRNKEPVILRSMGKMTGETAFSACGRLVRENNGFPFVRMAAEAEIVAALRQKFRVLGGVWVMTLDAHSFLEWGVLFVSSRLEVIE